MTPSIAEIERPEVSSAEPIARGMNNTDLVQTVSSAFTKIREALPYIIELRRRFATLQDGDVIAGCDTWTEFCERVLHRTDRAVRMAIAESNREPEPEEPDEGQDDDVFLDTDDPAQFRGKNYTAPAEEFQEYYQKGYMPPPSSEPLFGDLFGGQVPESIRKAAEDIIKEGRRALAMKHHPDKGGNAESMTVVNQAAQWMSVKLFS